MNMIIGIDLGTTNSLVSYFSEKGTVIIPNKFGEKLTPSVVSFGSNGEVYVGKVAKERMITHPESTKELFKRSMGSKKEFIINENKFTAEELSSFIIRSLKEDAEEYLGSEVNEAIISVPAYFNDKQRKATQLAGKLAGLKVERIVNEPTAAAIAYGLQNRNTNTKFLVFDLGGGTFDVSILEVYKNIMEVHAVAGDNYLGGDDFTEILVNMFLRANELEACNLDSTTIAIIKKQAEEAKKMFSKQKEVIIKCKVNDEILKYKISLDDYEKNCELLLAKIRKPIERALKDAEIKLHDIDEILLIGGATKLPIIRNFVGKLFGRLPNISINPEEAVALGAGIQGAMKERNELIKDIVLTDVCPYTLGTEISVLKEGEYYEGGHFCPIIERNTVVPVSRTERLYTIHDNQSSIKVEILQGESRFAKNNVYLGEINIPVPIGKAGEQAVDVTYTYDINSILEVEVTVVSTKLKKHLIIKKSDNDMSDEEIQERFKELSELKIPPREQEENKLILSMGESIYEQSVGETRREVEFYLRKFENILDKQNRDEIKAAAKELKEKFEFILSRNNEC